MGKEQELRALMQDIAEKKNEQAALAKQLIALSKRVKVLDKEVDEKGEVVDTLKRAIVDMEARLEAKTNKILEDLETEKEILAQNLKTIADERVTLESQAGALVGKSKDVENVLAEAGRTEKKAENLVAVADEKEAVVAKKEAKLKSDRVALLEEKKEVKALREEAVKKEQKASAAAARATNALEAQVNAAATLVKKEEALAVRNKDVEGLLADGRDVIAKAKEDAKKADKKLKEADSKLLNAQTALESAAQAQLTVDADLNGIKDEKRMLELSKIRLKKIVRDNKLDEEILKGV